ncbi:NAD(P)/FAD-dependent oxidoreductase [Runella zeae]|uniref:NAD(P)/FAD-dependent oxidoreductase n=1 Tax=Runella zeae TaxID=94255 RepID=UPI000411E8B0|nr:FAD-dependent oxidoreductase [Runella zeae]
MPSCIIIGAGMTGLTAANLLQRDGWQVTVLDKGRGVGGRLATRRLSSSRADHGAQYFTARTPEFQQHIADWQQAGIVKEWNLSSASTTDITFQHPRYIGVEGMNSIAKYMAQNLSVLTNEKAITLTKSEAEWAVNTENGNIYTANHIILTLPAPQALDLLAQSAIALSPEHHLALTSIQYAPCIAVVASLHQKSLIPNPGVLKFDTGSIAWVADNFQKGITAHPSVTIHASADFSRQKLEEDLNTVGQELMHDLVQWIVPSNLQTMQVHRWRYSLAEQRWAAPYLALDISDSLLIGGDAFGMGNVEGAFQSGFRMAQFLFKK